jgi:hypothetical protein
VYVGSVEVWAVKRCTGFLETSHHGVVRVRAAVKLFESALQIG